MLIAQLFLHISENVTAFYQYIMEDIAIK